MHGRSISKITNRSQQIPFPESRIRSPAPPKPQAIPFRTIERVRAPVDLGGVALTSEPVAVIGGPHIIDVFYRGPNLWTNWWPDKPWLDAQTGNPLPNPATYDLVTQAFDPDNGMPLNPGLALKQRPTRNCRSLSLRRSQALAASLHESKDLV
jgi:hypothetical protein